MPSLMTIRSPPRGKQEQLLEEILVRVKSMQDSLDSKDIEEILKEPRYQKALHEALEDIKMGREKPLSQVLKEMRKAR